MILFNVEMVKVAEFSDSDLKLELAILLFEREKISLRKAAKMAGIDWLDFSKVLCERNIPTVRMTDEEFQEEINTVKSLLK